MKQVSIIGVDLAKQVFQLHGATQAWWFLRSTVPTTSSASSRRHIIAPIRG